MRAVVGASALLLLACGAAREPVREPARADAADRAADRATAPAASRPSAPIATPSTAAADPVDPAVLLPDPTATDAELDRVAGRALHKHDVYDRLLELDAPRAAELRELLCLDLLVAAQVRAQGITVAASEVQGAVDEELGRLRARFDAELRGRMSFAGFLAREFGLDEDGYRRWLWRRAARALLRERAIRYWSWQRDRVTCRFLRVADAALAQELHQKLLAGADLGILARKHSADETRDLGGLLPEFAADFRHPVADIARRLKTGELSAVVPIDQDGGRSYYLVHCLARTPARREPYPAVAAELQHDLKQRPVTAFESTAFYLAARQAENPLEGSGAHR